MTIYLALDYISASFDLPNGEIVAINRTTAGLEAAGYGTAQGYTGNRRRSIDETSADWDINCEPGWYYLHTGHTPKVMADLPRTAAQQRADQVALDIARLKAALDQGVLDWELILAKERFAPHTDSGHALSDDIMHGLIKGWIRVHVTGLAAAKANPTQDLIDAYTPDLTRFILLAETLGVVAVYDKIAANPTSKAEWRGNRAGTTAYRYDTADGGILRDEHNAAVGTVAVTYPTGENVMTWDALAAVDAL